MATVSAFVVRLVKVVEECGCCDGAVEGLGYVCEPCEAAMRAGDRSAHPHPPSDAQRALIDAEGLQGGGVEEVEVMVISANDSGIAMILAEDARKWPRGHPCRLCNRYFAEHPHRDCEGWR